MLPGYFDIKNSYLYIKDVKSFFDVPREKLSPRPFLLIQIHQSVSHVFSIFLNFFFSLVVLSIFKASVSLLVSHIFIVETYTKKCNFISSIKIL
jgi:hypothetical protein